MRLLGHLTHGAAEVDVDHADLVFVDQSSADLGHRLGLVVPDLHRQRPSFIADSPQSIGVFAFVFVEPHEAARVDHLGRL